VAEGSVKMNHKTLLVAKVCVSPHDPSLRTDEMHRVSVQDDNLCVARRVSCSSGPRPYLPGPEVFSEFTVPHGATECLRSDAQKPRVET
jgi:hypothetical protein